MLYNIIISPIETIVDWVFNFIIARFSSFGVFGAVFGVSLVINILALPLYNIADSLQERERIVAKRLEYRVKRIKKAFRGNEQFMMLSTYYKQNNYHPLFVLRSSLSILIEIPFFIAAYHYLSNCELLRGSSFFIFSDLGKPDGLLHIGRFSIHVLPIIMTLINFVSGAIYTRGGTLKEKIQLYVVAILFLVLLYSSPSGLVIYWILNNIFSLIKNIVVKTKNPRKVFHFIISVFVLLISFYSFRMEISLWKKIILLVFSLVIIVYPYCNSYFSKKISSLYSFDKKIDLCITLFSGIGLTLLLGYLIPANVISSSPIEFSFLNNIDSPIFYIKKSFCIFSGFFIFWPIVIYFMFGDKVKRFESFLFLILFLVSLFNVYLFKSNYGNLNILLELENVACLIPNKNTIILSVISLLLIICFAFIFRISKFNNLIVFFILAICLGEFSLGCVKCNSIKSTFNVISENKNNKKEKQISVEYNFSKSGNNVVVLFLDRAIGSFVPEIFERYPEIKEQFNGFVYYPNTVSFSSQTIEGTPPLMGGYEYTQDNINLRDTELLREKHNEASLFMPKLFYDAGFEVTVTDPPWPNYYWSGDLSAFDKYPYIKVSEIEEKYFSNFKIEKNLLNNRIDELCSIGIIDFSVLQALFPIIRRTFYQTARRKSNPSDNSSEFFSQFSHLYYLPEMTGFSASNNSFFFIENETTHNVVIDLDENLEEIAEKQTGDITVQHFQADAAAFKQLGKWFDYLRKNGVYDNTRFVIVSDHGYNGDVPCGDLNVSAFGALLMYKDFNASEEVNINNEFMTTADTIFLAKDNLSISNINPFTGKELKQNKENGVNVYLCSEWNAEHLRNSKTFKLNKENSWHVSNNIFEKENWIPLIEWEKEGGQK